MSVLSTVTKGRQEHPYLILLYGGPGVGKTTFASEMPDPIFVGAEMGTAALDVARLPTPKNWDELMNQLTALKTEEHSYKTVVIDSIDWAESIMHRQICKTFNVSSLELAQGGYGKGYTEALNWWHRFIDQLNVLRFQKHMNICLIAHADIYKFEDPTLQVNYDRYQIKLHKKAASLFKEYVDFILFARQEVNSKKEGLKNRAYGDGERIMYTESRPGFDAKSRYKIEPAYSFLFKNLDDEIKKIHGQENAMKAIKALVEGKDNAFIEEARSRVQKSDRSFDALKKIYLELRDILDSQNIKELENE